MSRRAELAANLARVRQRITAAGADPAAVTIVAVTKSFPASDIRLLADLGVTDIGENRDQEARQKWEQLHDLQLRWHFVGQLQANKSRSVARYADIIHSVDRPALVDVLAAAARRQGRRLTCLVQVAFDPRPGRAGVAPGEVDQLCAAIADRPDLRLGGVMTIAPLGVEPAPVFARLAELAGAVRSRYPDASIVSAGMSADLEAAVHCGATHLRIGTALLGGRPAVVG
jgi:pyridoxal phosphate enzyme (YggS family)